MLAKLAQKISSLPVFKGDMQHMPVDRTHFRKSDHPYEIELANILLEFPDEELVFLSMRYGLTGKDPLDAPQIAAGLGKSFMRVLDIGTAAELRLRNSNRAASAIERLVALEMSALLDHVAQRQNLPASRQWRASRAWMLSRRPIQRLALDTLMEGGIGVLISHSEGLLAQSRNQSQAAVEHHVHQKRVF